MGTGVPGLEVLKAALKEAYGGANSADRRSSAERLNRFTAEQYRSPVNLEFKSKVVYRLRYLRVRLSS